jgi:nucleotide-binding universal stress UspA family protein
MHLLPQREPIERYVGLIGRSGVARWIVGGVADKVVCGANVPVLLHRPHDQAQAS